MKNSLNNESEYFNAFIKTAQYLATLTTYEGIWIHLEKLIREFYKADFAYFYELGYDGKIIEHQKNFMNNQFSKKIFEKVKEPLAQVMDSGFFASEIINIPESYAIVLLLIKKAKQIIGVMVIGHQRTESLPKYLLNIYLALMGLVGTTIDNISMLEELKYQRNNLTNILDSMEDGVYIVNQQYDIEYVNQSLKKEFGSFENKKCYEYFHDSQEVCSWCKNLDVFMGKTVRWEWYSPKNQKLYDLIDTPLKNPDGSISKLEMFHDITERKKAEEKIAHINSILRAIRKVNQLITKEKNLEKRLKGLCDNLIKTHGYFHAWIVHLDKSGNLISTAEAGLGEEFLPLLVMLKKGEIIKCQRKVLSQSDVLTIDDPNVFCVGCPLSKIYEGRAVMAVRLEYNEKIFGWLTVSLPREMIEEKDEQELFKEVADDIAFALYNVKLKKSEESYREAYSRAEFYKDLITHDINNILQSILSGMQLSQLYLNNAEKLEDLNEIYEMVQNQVKRGANLVLNIRKLSQLKETKISVTKTEMCKVLKNTIILVKKAYPERNIDIQINSIGKKLYVQANELLVDVFENIIHNAVRHNKKPLVEIIIRISKEQIKKINYCKIEFLDNGIGINDSRKKLIFLRGHSKDKSANGMGLGLSLIKIIVNTYKGKIWVENRIKGDYSKGSNFILLIPEGDLKS